MGERVVGTAGHPKNIPSSELWAVMDVWKPFRNSTLKAEHAPQAAILFDKFDARAVPGETAYA
jgi:hypothetical protein